MDGVFVKDGVFAMDGVDGDDEMDAMDTVDSSESESESDDPVSDEAMVSLLDGTNADAPAPPRWQQHAPDNDISDLSSVFDSDRSSDFGDLPFDYDPAARVESTLHRYGTLDLFSRPPGQEQQPADPTGSYVIPDALCCPPPTDVDFVRVNPVSGFQSADMRFGPGTRAAMTKWLLRTLGGNGPIDDDVDVASRPNTDAEAYDCYEEDGHMVDTLDFSQPDGPLPVSESRTSDKAQPSSSPLSSGPAKSQDPSATESTETFGTESWDTPPMHAASSAKGPEPRKPPPVARARLNLTALSQKYNLFFAAFREEVHVFRPQQAPEIVRGALLVLRPQPTEAAKMIGGYQDTAAPHQVNHMIIGDLGDAEILLMAFDDGDVIAYYTEHIVEYLSSKWRGHPTLSPKKPTPFFRETVGSSAWGLDIHREARLMAVSSNLAEVTVFAPALYGKHAREAMERGESVYTEPDRLGSGLAIDTSRYDLKMLREALRKRTRNWRILLPLGRNGANIPSIAFTGFENPPDTIVATDINGCIWLLNIWQAKCKPLRDKLGHARASNERGWGILSLPRDRMLRTKKLPYRIPAILSRKHGLLTHSLDYSLITDPSTDAFIQTPATHYDPDTLDDIILPGVPYTKRMLYELDVLAKNKGDELAYDVDGDSDYHDHGSGEESDDSRFDMMIDPITNQVHAENADYEYFRNNPDEGMSPAPSNPRIRDKPFTAVDLTSGFFQSMIACPSTSQTWPAPDLSGLLDILLSPSRHESIIDENMEIQTNYTRPIPWSDISIFEAIGGTDWVDEYYEDDGPFQGEEVIGEEDEDGEDKDEEEEDAAPAHHRAYNTGALDSWDDCYDIGQHYFFLQTLSNGAQMFAIDVQTDIYQVDDITSFTTDEEIAYSSGDMVDMLPPFHRCSMIHFIPEIRLIVVGKMQGQVVLLRPLKDDTTTEEPRVDEHRTNLTAANTSRSGFRTEWTLPLQKDRTEDKYPRCCLLGIAVSRVPESGADKYALKAEKQPTDGRKPRDQRKAPRRRWRLIMYYMDHTILQYYIEESDDGNAIGGVMPVLQEVQQASRRRQQADPSRPLYQDGIRVA